MLSLVKPHNYYQNFLAQGIGMGLAMGILFMPSLSIASHYFKKRRALAMGIMLSGEFPTSTRLFVVTQSHSLTDPSRWITRGSHLADSTESPFHRQSWLRLGRASGLVDLLGLLHNRQSHHENTTPSPNKQAAD